VKRNERIRAGNVAHGGTGTLRRIPKGRRQKPSAYRYARPGSTRPSVLVSPTTVVPLSIMIWKRHRAGSPQGLLASALALLPVPLHFVTLRLVEVAFGVHFFWR